MIRRATIRLLIRVSLYALTRYSEFRKEAEAELIETGQWNSSIESDSKAIKRCIEVLDRMAAR